MYSKAQVAEVHLLASVMFLYCQLGTDRQGRTKGLAKITLIHGFACGVVLCLCHRKGPPWFTFLLVMDGLRGFPAILVFIMPWHLPVQLRVCVARR